MNCAIILVPENLVGGKVDFFLNGVNPISVLHATEAIQSIILNQLYERAKAIVGDNDELIQKEIEKQLAEFKQVADGEKPKVEINQN